MPQPQGAKQRAPNRPLNVQENMVGPAQLVALRLRVLRAWLLNPEAQVRPLLGHSQLLAERRPAPPHSHAQRRRQTAQDLVQRSMIPTDDHDGPKLYEPYMEEQRQLPRHMGSPRRHGLRRLKVARGQSISVIFTCTCAIYLHLSHCLVFVSW